MSQPDQDDDKQFDPTPKKLEDARKKGEVPRSVDLTTAAAYAGFVVAAFAIGATSLSRIGAILADVLANAPTLAQDIFNGGQQARVGGIAMSIITWASPWFAIPAAAVILAIVAQRSFVVAPTKLMPKLSRLSIVANAKNKFGRSGIFEFVKSFTKLLIYSTVLGTFLVSRTPEIIMTVNLHPNFVAAIMLKLSLSFILLVLVVAVTIGAVDFLWQRAEHIRKNRMSRKEVVDEAKQMEGDPHIKQQRRQRGQAIALNQMLADVPDADVIVVNPEHFAVALAWSRAPGSAPICVAKGVDEVAARIREIANKNAVPIHRSPATARAIYAAVDIGQQIWPEHYQAVAAAIRFAEQMSRQAKSAGWRS